MRRGEEVDEMNKKKRKRDSLTRRERKKKWNLGHCSHGHLSILLTFIFFCDPPLSSSSLLLSVIENGAVCGRNEHYTCICLGLSLFSTSQSLAPVDETKVKVTQTGRYTDSGFDNRRERHTYRDEDFDLCLECHVIIITISYHVS